MTTSTGSPGGSTPMDPASEGLPASPSPGSSRMGGLDGTKHSRPNPVVLLTAGLVLGAIIGFGIGRAVGDGNDDDAGPTSGETDSGGGALSELTRQWPGT